jgi:hypothetical protein
MIRCRTEMAAGTDPIIAIVGNTTAAPAGFDVVAAAESLGGALAKAGFRILVYSSGPGYLEGPVVKGYVASQAARDKSIQICYPLDARTAPDFPEQKTHSHFFDPRPDHIPNWETSFYLSLNEVDGIVLVGGGDSTLIAGMVALGHRLAVVALPGFGGKAIEVWKALTPGRDLLSVEERSEMASPWASGRADRCAQILTAQLARRAEAERARRMADLRREAFITRHAAIAGVLFVLAILCIAATLGGERPLWLTLTVLFVSPMLAGVSGSTIRLVFDWQQGKVSMTSQSAITTAMLGLIAGGAAALLFTLAQTAALKELSNDAARRLIPFAVAVGFVAGLTLDAVFRKLITSDVVELSAVESKKRP